MNAQSPGSISELTVCPSCGAAVANDAKLCWLCGWDLADELVTAEVVGEPSGYVQESTSTRIALIVGIVTLGVVTVGVFAAAPGIGVLMGIVFVIATFAVAKGLQSGGPMTTDQAAIEQAYASPATAATVKHGSVVADVFKVLGIIALIALASIIAFLTFCVICIVVLSNA
ncbi:MAG: zinc ribbon domain-containing protein [Planctomycetota bacterium]|nr:zinc ribbon domain-containing protein [Planctomycetota bacterium]